MVETFRNVCDWILIHYEAIVTVLTSAQFASLAALITLLVKQIRKVNKNTNTSSALTIKIQELDDAKLKIVECTEEVKHLRLENEQLKKEQMLMNEKLSLFFEAQTILYSTHKNENTRANLLRLSNKARTLSYDELTVKKVKAVEVSKTSDAKSKNKTVATVEQTERY